MSWKNLLRPSADDSFPETASNAFITRCVHDALSSIPPGILRPCVCLALDVLVARAHAKGGLPRCVHRDVVNGRLWAEPRGGGGGGLHQWLCRSAPLVDEVHSVARGLALGLAGVRVPGCLYGAGGRRPPGPWWHLAAITGRGSCGVGCRELLTRLLGGRPARRRVRLAWIRLASLFLGVVWAVWHLPLFYSVGTVQSHLPMGLYALSAIASSVLFAWLFNRSQGSVVPVMVLPDGSDLRPFQIVFGILVLTAVALLFRGERTLNKATCPE